MPRCGENRCYTCGNFKDQDGLCVNPCCPEYPGFRTQNGHSA